MIELVGHDTCEGCAAAIKAGMGGYCRLNYARDVIAFRYGDGTEYRPKGLCPKPKTMDELTIIINKKLEGI